MTGSNVDTPLRLGTRHRLVKIELANLNSAYTHAYALDTALDVRLFRAQGSVEGTKYHEADIWAEEDIEEALITEPFGVGFEYEETDWTLRLLGQNGNLVSVAVYVQVEAP
jgi:hypothetical protein